ncbi:MAG: putative glycoside hydrolase [Acidimicrobiia bacterium]|nr:putative glycoside hydrolase [Acidimicrobiia bacterium]
MRRLPLPIAAVALLLSACAGPSVLLAGESMRPPEPPPPTLSFAVVGADDLTPVVADIAVGEEAVTTDEDGLVTVIWNEEPVSVTASAAGFHEGAISVTEQPLEGPIEIRLDPVVLNGRVLSADGRPLPASTVRLGNLEAVSDGDGEFAFFRAIPGNVAVERPAWEPNEVAWDGSTEDITVELQPRMINALRVAGDNSGAGNATKWQELLDLADRTGINAFVVDTTEEGGLVLHDTDVALAYEIGAVIPFYDVEQVLADMDAHNLYKITRIVTFQSDFLARARPEIAATDVTTGKPWVNNKNLAWLDPTDRSSWDYPLALAEEACRLGFDEIQFDYVRFPSDGPISNLSFDELSAEDYYSEASQQKRVETISAFLAEAHSRLNPMGCAVAADIFAITLESTSDEGIGQAPGPFSHHVDVLSPMIYTYTYGPGWKGWDDPDEHATELVEAALDAGIPRLDGFALYRPWLQRAFLEDSEILAIQNVAEERDLGWMLWSAGTIFDAGHLPPAE